MILSVTLLEFSRVYHMVPSYQVMVEELGTWMKDHKNLYSHYFS